MTVGTAAAVGDTDTLNGVDSPSGSVTYALYSIASRDVTTGLTCSGTISSGTASFSHSFTPSAPGTYYWIASYAGDGNNNGFTTTCGDANEQISVGKASPG